MANQIVWCDIPVLDLDRAIKFYSAVLGQDVKKQEFPGTTMGILAHNDGEVGACLFTSADEKPTERGTMVYLNANGRLDEALSAVTRNGGKIVQPKHQIGPFGFRDRLRQREQSHRVAFRLDFALCGDSA